MNGIGEAAADPQARCTTCGRALAGECPHEVYDGTRRCFCSARCQAEFELHPERYLSDCGCLDRPCGYS